MQYNDFLEAKRQSSIDSGIEPLFINDSAFDYQRYVAEHAIHKGLADNTEYVKRLAFAVFEAVKKVEPK